MILLGFISANSANIFVTLFLQIISKNDYNYFPNILNYSVVIFNLKLQNSATGFS